MYNTNKNGKKKNSSEPQMSLVIEENPRRTPARQVNV